MTEFHGETEATKPAEVIKIPEPQSRVKSDPKLWEESGTLADMLSYCRPHQSKTERKFIAKYIVPLGGIRFDKKGNAYKKIGDNPVVLWSCHTDTVHTVQGTQKIVYWHKTNGDVMFEVGNDKIALAKQSSCLGADDTVGVWLMTEMIKANVPGLYIFHRGEEVGCQGSKWIAENNKKALEGIKFAIAFDRRGEKSIITHQMSSRCCSDEFAKSLADQLGMGHECDTTGSITDTKSYVDLIPECTNLSVGYNSAHSRTENTNVDYAFNLRDALLKIDVSKLVEKRKAGDNERLVSSYSSDYYSSYGSWWGRGGWSSKSDHKKEDGKSGYELRAAYKGKGDFMDDYDWDPSFALWFPKPDKKSDGDIVKKLNHTDFVRMIRMNPEAVADILESYGCDAAQLRQELFELDSQTTIFL